MADLREGWAGEVDGLKSNLLNTELRIVAADCGIKSVIVRNRQVMLFNKKENRTVAGRHPVLSEEKTTPMLKELIRLIPKIPDGPVFPI